jgi:hypothetical protein
MSRAGLAAGSQSEHRVGTDRRRLREACESRPQGAAGSLTVSAVGLGAAKQTSVEELVTAADHGSGMSCQAGISYPIGVVTRSR